MPKDTNIDKDLVEKMERLTQSLQDHIDSERERKELELAAAGQELTVTTLAACMAAIKQFPEAMQVSLLRGVPWVEALCSDLTRNKALVKELKAACSEHLAYIDGLKGRIEKLEAGKANR